MTLAATDVGPAAPAIGLRQQIRASERRRHQRVAVNLLGRYMLSDRHEYPCQVVDMSPGGVKVIAPVNGSEGERVVFYLDHVGRVEGVVARVFDNGFAIQVSVPLIKREKFAEQLTWLTNRQVLGLPEDRRHERIVPNSTRNTITLSDDSAHSVKLLDISISGAAMLCEIRPAVGAPVTVGKTQARVVRVSPSGLAVEFLRLLPADTFDQHVIL